MNAVAHVTIKADTTAIVTVDGNVNDDIRFESDYLVNIIDLVIY